MHMVFESTIIYNFALLKLIILIYLSSRVFIYWLIYIFVYYFLYWRKYILITLILILALILIYSNVMGVQKLVNKQIDQSINRYCWWYINNDIEFVQSKNINNCGFKYHVHKNFKDFNCEYNNLICSHKVFYWFK